MAPDVGKLIDELGGPSKAAAALGIKNPSVVMNWRARGQIPGNWARKVESLTGVSCHDLRPDIFGPSPDQGAAA
ncbi:helix-turn-helix domain-containing protein [Aminobacter anthyllidis]|uniref:Helix-turn-helix domain-containing protein n=1 Tax=Aminobacter anthyllidis TaxID=1035067 RepID=A0A9X1A6S8_9HYPH|nr:YdaS family helix-turn-helix protein [Aminobacter anthyllidis]MBT1154328.1 helix-turn-helix domain-containing protein [Aminobacter anthyllidis]